MARKIRARVFDEHGNDLGIREIDPEEITIHKRMQHEDLGPVLPIVRWQYRLFGYLLHDSFEKWELGFLCDENYLEEIGLWSRATYAWAEFRHRHPTFDPETLFTGLCDLMNGGEGGALPFELQQELMELGENPPAGIFDLAKFSEDGFFNTDSAHLR